MKTVLTCSLLVAVAQVAGIVACNDSKSADGKNGGESNVAAASPASSAPGSGGSGKVGKTRTPVDCAKHLSESERISVSVGYPMKAEPGSWGGVASVLRALPPSATLCGAQYFVSKKTGSVSKDAGSVIISSALNGDELRAFYQPVFTKAGCTFAEKTAGAYDFSWNCPKGLGNALTIVVDRDFGVFAIGFVANAS